MTNPLPQIAPARTATPIRRPATDAEQLDCGHVAAAGETVVDDGWAAWCVPCDDRTAPTG
jgi:hypothetical protein